MNNNKYSITKIIFSIILLVWGISGLKNEQNFVYISAVNLMIHEFGHFSTFFMPELFMAFAGTLMQLLVPNLFLFYFLNKRSFYSASVMLFWISVNLFYISPYIKDARSMDLPLLFQWGTHDWNYILRELNLLKYDQIIGNTVFILGIIYLLLSFVLGLYFSKKPDTSSPFKSTYN